MDVTPSQQHQSHELPPNNPPKNPSLLPAFVALSFFAVIRLFICSSFGFIRKFTAFLLPPAPLRMTSFSWSGAPRSVATDTPVALTFALLTEPRLELVVARRRSEGPLKANESEEPALDVKKAIFDVADEEEEDEDA